MIEKRNSILLSLVNTKTILIFLVFTFCFKSKAEIKVNTRTISVTPVTNDAYLINPGKGWIIYSNFNNANSAAWAKAAGRLTGRFRARN